MDYDAEGLEPVVGSLFDDVIEQLPDEDTSQLHTAGVDDCTPCDTFLNSNGRNIFVTEVN